jgi:hypothetical protein
MQHLVAEYLCSSITHTCTAPHLVRCLSAASLSRHGCLVRLVYADTSGSGCCSLDGGRRMPNGSVASSGCAASTRPLLNRLCAADPGTEV